MKKQLYILGILLVGCMSNTTILKAQDNFVDHLDHKSTALLITDPQNDFLKEGGAAFALVKDNLEEVGTIENIDLLFRSAKASNVPVFISPHIYFPQDAKWESRGSLQSTMDQIDMFRVSHPINHKNFIGSGADFLEQYKKYILDDQTIISSPHKIYGPDSNDLVLQLRKRGIQNVIIGGMAANLCTDSHMRELIENGFNVIMIKDAVGAPGDVAYQAALTNYSLIANSVLSTEEAVKLIENLK